ncbi:MAG: MFS transporter [Chloroflexi bacterium]|nr:MFS transporter [Chloroflexota bacterium]
MTTTAQPEQQGPRLVDPRAPVGALAAGAEGASAPVALAPPATPRAPASGVVSRTFDSLQIPAFRWFVLSAFGMFSSMNMQLVVKGYLTFQLTGSYAALGLMSLANALPGLALSMAGGVLADRVSKKHIMQWAQALSAVNSLAIAVLLALGMLRFEHLFISAIFQGGVQAIMMPARQSIVPELVGMRRLMNAIALNSAGMNTMRLVGPAAAGLLIAAVGSAWVYFIITGLYMFAVATMLPIPARPAPAAEPVAAAVAAPAVAMRGRGGARSVVELVDGFRYVGRNRLIGMLLVVNFLVVMGSMPYMMLLPGFVEDRLGGGAKELGLLMSISGSGALVGSLVLASMPPRHRGRILLGAALVLALTLIVFAWSTSFVLSMGLMVLVGLAQQGRMSISNALLQHYVDEVYRGRVMSIYMMEFSLMSLGVFFLGFLAEAVGAEWAIGGSAAVLVLVVAALYTSLPQLRNLD